MRFYDGQCGTVAHISEETADPHRCYLFRARNDVIHMTMGPETEGELNKLDLPQSRYGVAPRMACHCDGDLVAAWLDLPVEAPAVSED